MSDGYQLFRCLCALVIASKSESLQCNQTRWATVINCQRPSRSLSGKVFIFRSILEHVCKVLVPKVVDLESFWRPRGGRSGELLEVDLESSWSSLGGLLEVSWRCMLFGIAGFSKEIQAKLKILVSIWRSVRINTSNILEVYTIWNCWF